MKEVERHYDVVIVGAGVGGRAMANRLAATGFADTQPLDAGHTAEAYAKNRRIEKTIATAETAAWTWDARPYPAFPARSDVWTDADNWRLGHWLNGRLGAVSLGSLVRELCRRAGLP